VKPSISSITLTFVKDQASDEAVMEIMALLSDGQIVQKAFPVNGKVIRLDAEYLLPMPKNDQEEDGA
jgi:hypothetical protein